MNRDKTILLIFFLANFIVIGCIVSIKPSQGNFTVQPTSGSWRCDPVPDDFQETDLVGTWQTIFGLSLKDTLSVLETGFYTQDSVDNVTGYHFVSEPKRWWLEKQDDGGMYVHFEGMLFCGGVQYCVDPHEAEMGFYDFCSDRWFEMDGEFVLAVIGDPSVSSGIWLRHMRPAGNETFFAEYILLEE